MVDRILKSVKEIEKNYSLMLSKLFQSYFAIYSVKANYTRNFKQVVLFADMGNKSFSNLIFEAMKWVKDNNFKSFAINAEKIYLDTSNPNNQSVGSKISAEVYLLEVKKALKKFDHKYPYVNDMKMKIIDIDFVIKHLIELDQLNKD
jgi:hypothetical protein